MKSWKTTLTGVLAILAALIPALQAQLTTGKAEWSTAIAAGIAGIGLIFARDAGVSSEQQGIK